MRIEWACVVRECIAVSGENAEPIGLRDEWCALSELGGHECTAVSGENVEPAGLHDE